MTNLNQKSETRNSKQIRNSNLETVSNFSFRASNLFRFSNFVFRICLVFLISYFVFAKQSLAETLTSPSYKIRMGNFNMTSGMKSSASYSLTDTVGQIAAEFFAGAGYHVKAGFQYLYTLYPFSFSISSLAINFGALSPNTFTTASHTLTVTAPGQGYSVTAYETNKLTKSGSSDTIPDTTCDSGLCAESAATVWTTATNNGFGYNATGNDVAADFLDSTYFRPFPDLSLAESPATVMTSASAGKARTATITYKISPSAIQAAGDYSTQIVYIATPVY